jgi:predicted ABC-type transport system involved in lysophospholipase L1 biosynthesis ATPase subunit
MMVMVGISLKERREKAVSLLEKVQMGDRIDHFPYMLSGGERSYFFFFFFFF